VAFPAYFWLGHSGGDHCEHPCAAADQIAWSTLSFDASSNHRFDDCILAFPCVLEICATTLFERQLVICSRLALSRRSLNTATERPGYNIGSAARDDCRATPTAFWVQNWQAERLPYNGWAGESQALC